MRLKNTFYIFTVCSYYMTCSSTFETKNFIILGYRTDGGYCGKIYKYKININITVLLLKLPNTTKIRPNNIEKVGKQIQMKAIGLIYKGDNENLNVNILEKINEENLVNFDNKPKNFNSFFITIANNYFIRIIQTYVSFRFVPTFEMKTKRFKLSLYSHKEKSNSTKDIRFNFADGFFYKIFGQLSSNGSLEVDKSISISYNNIRDVFHKKIIKIENDDKNKINFKFLWRKGKTVKPEYIHKNNEDINVQKPGKNNDNTRRYADLFIVTGILFFVLSIVIIFIIISRYKKRINRKILTKYERKMTINNIV